MLGAATVVVKRACLLITLLTGLRSGLRGSGVVIEQGTVKEEETYTGHSLNHALEGRESSLSGSLPLWLQRTTGI